VFARNKGRLSGFCGGRESRRYSSERRAEGCGREAIGMKEAQLMQRVVRSESRSAVKGN